MCVVLRARDLAPELTRELEIIDEHLGSIRGALEAVCVRPPTTESTLGSLYSWTSRSRRPRVGEQAHRRHDRADPRARGRSYLFGPEPGDETDDGFDEPASALDAPDRLRRDLDAIDAARHRLRDLPH